MVGAVVGAFAVTEAEAVEGIVEVDQAPALRAVAPVDQPPQESVVGSGHEVVDAAEVESACQIDERIDDQGQGAEINDSGQGALLIAKHIAEEEVTVHEAPWRQVGQRVQLGKAGIDDPFRILQVFLQIGVGVGKCG